MKEYLKMANVFELPIYHFERGGFSHKILDCNTYELGVFTVEDQAQAATHAVNSHDELVAEVAKLTDFCERFSIFCEDVGEFMGSGRNANSVRNEYMEHKLSKAP